MAGATPLKTFGKDPNATLDYVVDWTSWLNGDLILTSTWILDAGIANAGEGRSGQMTVIWLSGGTDGSSYQVTNRITTVAGRTDDRTFQINAVNK